MPRSGVPAIAARGWGWRHAGRRAWAVRGLDLSIEPGERVLLLGASGSGKSTLLSAIAGVLGGADEGEEEGRLSVGGEPPAAVRGRAGLVLQDPDSQVVLARVGDDVAFACENLGVDPDLIPGRVREALEAVQLGLALDHPTDRLSGGQKQRLAIAGALAMRPDILLLDEPTANLDPQGAREVRAAVGRAVSGGRTLVVVEHRVAEWLPLVDRVIVLGEAEGVIADGPPGDVFRAAGPVLEAAGVWVPRAVSALVPARGRPGETSGVPLLRTAGLSVARPSGPVLPQPDLQVSAGECLAIVGPNGVGKSTLALTLGGLLPEQAGAVEAQPALRRRLGSRPFDWRSRELVRRVGTVFQDPEHQFLRRTVREELALGPRAAGSSRAEADARAAEVLQALGLAPLAEANPFTLSGGQKRRLSVGTALAAAPDVLILDEPTFGQDRHGWSAMARLLAARRDAGTALVIVTHDEPLVRALGDRVVVLGSAVLDDAGPAEAA